MFVSTLGRILSPITAAEFVGQHFQRRPLMLRGTRGKFDFLFRDSDFKLRLDRVTEIRAVFPGLWQAVIHPADIKEMVHAGASICVTGMEKAHPKLQRAAREIRRELNYSGEVSFRAYLSPPGRGFDLHFDARVATTLQIVGTKRWWYSPDPATPFPTKNSTHPLTEAKERPPRLAKLKSVLLRPGDVLCLPAGVWHRARAQTLSLALNMAFDHHGAGVLDSIADALRKRLEIDPAWREPLPITLGKDRGTLPLPIAAVLRERIDLLQRELTRMRGSDAALKHVWQMATRG